MIRACAIALALVTGACLPSYRTVPAPPAQAMPSSFAAGEWDSTFGHVTIAVHSIVTGAWTYVDPETSREVHGLFRGTLSGNVLHLTWTEDDASGFGFLEFAPDGSTYGGRWWNSTRTKTGIWRGWRRSEG